MFTEYNQFELFSFRFNKCKAMGNVDYIPQQ